MPPAYVPWNTAVSVPGVLLTKRGNRAECVGSASACQWIRCVKGTWFVSVMSFVSHIHLNAEIHENVAIFVLGASYKIAVVVLGVW